MPLAISFISDFLSTVEGPRQTVGYIPCFKVAGGTANYKGAGDPAAFKAMGASGVTIATGCDLGQSSVGVMRGYGLEEVIVRKLLPYFEHKKEAALRVLHRIPFTISADDAAAIDAAVHIGYLRKYVIPVFERECHKMRFVNLPKQAQATIASICFQKGVGGTKRDAPKTWAALVHCDWADAADRLCNRSLWREYQSRRGQEGVMLKGAV